MASIDDLASWTSAYLPPLAATDASLKLTPLTGDAGFRRYFRVNTRPGLMAVHAPPEHEDVAGFVTKDLAFRAEGVRVPEVYAVDYRRGFMLQEDLGEALLLSALNADTADRLYGQAEAELVKIQAVEPDSAIFPLYDEDELQREMALFPRWFVEQLLGLHLDRGEERILKETFDLLAGAALEQPRVVVHRDFHSRNLVISPEGNPGVIDFQDALVGAFTYDLVSLLKDCYIRWSTVMIRERALDFLRARVREAGQAPVEDARLLRWFDLMGLQRHIKVLGIFARLWLRDGKPSYLNDLPLVLRYSLEVTAAYPELGPLHRWLMERVVPVLPGQPWYRDWQTAGE